MSNRAKKLYRNLKETKEEKRRSARALEEKRKRLE